MAIGARVAVDGEHAGALGAKPGRVTAVAQGGIDHPGHAPGSLQDRVEQHRAVEGGIGIGHRGNEAPRPANRAG